MIRVFLLAFLFAACVFLPAFVVIETTGSSFEPDDVSGLQVWLDGTDVNGNGDGNSGLSDGDSVSTWDDKSTNAVNFTNTGSARPTFETSEQNSKPCLKFDSANSQYLAAASDDSDHSCDGGCTIFAVVKFGSGVTDAKFIFGKDGTNQREYAFVMTDTDLDSTKDDYAWFVFANLTTSYFQGEARNQHAASTTYVLSSDFPSGASPVNTDTQIYKNGSEVSGTHVTGGGGAGFPADDGTQAASVGARPGLSGAEWYLANDLVCELLFYDNKISSGDRISVETYLKDKWTVY